MTGIIEKDILDSGTIAITSQQLRRARAVFEAATGEPVSAREAILSRECDGDAIVRAWVEEMIEADARAHPALDEAVGLAGTVAQDDAAEVKPGDRIGAYRIVREIGAGGMGAVYQAEPAALTDAAKDRFVAIKVVRWCSQEISRRFRQEQTILARLQHPNIARLLESGTTGKQSPYFVMEYVEGEPIHAYCERNGLAPDERVRLFRQVLRAMIYLHQNLVVHRDIKPGNVLVTANGVVKLVDFGIAKLLQTSDGLPSPVKTIAGLMTPDYASPEQIRGGATSTLTDVYSLGVLLYELLTGERPFTAPADQVHETLRRICEEEPRKPSMVAAGAGRSQSRKLRGELDNIVLRAIRKEPERRYASVERFDDDLRRHLDGLPVLAQGDSLGYRIHKFVTRHKGGVAAVAGMLLLLSGGVIATGIEARIARMHRAMAESQAREAESARAIAEAQRLEANAQRAEANAQRIRAESKAAEADKERANAERRLHELQRLANGVVRIYTAASPQDSPALLAENVRDSLMVLGREQKLEPGLAEVLDRTSATVQSYQLANDPSWEVPAGWSASAADAREYRVGVDRRMVHDRQPSLFLRSLAERPQGAVTVTQKLDAASYRGNRVRLTSFLRSESVLRRAILGLVTVGGTVRANVSGTTSWKEYELVADVPAYADSIWFGLTLQGAGTVWACDFRIERVSASVPLTIKEPENLSFTEPGINDFKNR